MALVLVRPQPAEPKVARLLRGAWSILSHPSILKRKLYIFILIHMRSYSTLLAHILGSHDEISGSTEAFLTYRSAFHLFRLRALVCVRDNYKEGCTYILDKIIHNN